MIIDVDECKVLLGITDNTYNEQMWQLIPYIQDDIAEYCNRTFADTVVYRASVSDLAFVRGDTSVGTTDPDTITDVNQDFSTIGFRDNTDIVIVGGSNGGYHEISSVSSGTLTLRSTGELEDQSQTTYHRWPGPIAVAMVKWPKALKMTAAQMVWSKVDKPTANDVVSEKIDDYSVTYVGGGAEGGARSVYPQRVMAGLDRYRNVALV